MAKMVHSVPDNPIRSIEDQGRRYEANDKGEFDAPTQADADTLRRHGLVDKDAPKPA